MAIEDANYISGLIATNPPGTDKLSTADDHLRLLKSVLLGTFPNATGAITPTPAQFNGLANLTASKVVITNASGVVVDSTVTSAQLAQLAVTLAANKAVVTGAGGVLESAASTTKTQIGYLADVTGLIQAQIDAKAAVANGVTGGNTHDHSGGDGASLTGAAFAAITAGDYALCFVEKTQSIANASMAVVTGTAMYVGRTGTMRVYLGVAGGSVSSARKCQSQIYVNGLPVGTIREHAALDPQDIWSEDISVVLGDIIEIYARYVLVADTYTITVECAVSNPLQAATALATLS